MRRKNEVTRQRRQRAAARRRRPASRWQRSRAPSSPCPKLPISRASTPRVGALLPYLGHRVVVRARRRQQTDLPKPRAPPPNRSFIYIHMHTCVYACVIHTNIFCFDLYIIQKKALHCGFDSTFFFLKRSTYCLTCICLCQSSTFPQEIWKSCA